MFYSVVASVDMNIALNNFLSVVRRYYTYVCVFHAGIITISTHILWSSTFIFVKIYCTLYAVKSFIYWQLLHILLQFFFCYYFHGRTTYPITVFVVIRKFHEFDETRVMVFIIYRAWAICTYIIFMDEYIRIIGPRLFNKHY